MNSVSGCRLESTDDVICTIENLAISLATWDDMELESGESDLDSYAATVRTCWSVKAYSVNHWLQLSQKTSRKAILSNGEGELAGAAAVGGLLYEDPNFSTVEQNIEVDSEISVDETPGWLVVYCMRIYDCINWCDSNITFSKTEK